MKKMIYVLLSLSIIFILVGCKKNDELVKAGYLTVAVSPDYAPYEFTDTSKTGIDSIVGSDVSFMKYLAEELGLKLDIKVMSFDSCLMAVQTRKVDLAISGFSWTPKRAAAYEMSIGYFGEGDGEQQVLILKKNQDKYATLSSINNKSFKIGAQSGSIQEEFVDTQLPKATKELVTDLDIGVSLLLNGVIDGIAISEHAAAVRVGLNDSLAVINENFAVEGVGYVAVAKKGNTKLIEKVNTVIEKVVEEGLYVQWMEAAQQLAYELGELGDEEE